MAEAVPTPAPAPTFAPGPKHWRYVLALLELVSEGQKATRKAIGDRLGMSDEALKKWLARERKRQGEAFRQWVSDELSAWARSRRGHIEARAAFLAEQGSTEHIDRLAKLAGWYGTPGKVRVTPTGEVEADSGDGSPSVVVLSLVPSRDV